MSALGQKQTCAVQKAMSALCQKRTSLAFSSVPGCLMGKVGEDIAG